MCLHNLHCVVITLFCTDTNFFLFFSVFSLSFYVLRSPNLLHHISKDPGRFSTGLSCYIWPVFPFILFVYVLGLLAIICS
ncbi:hypothetical protein FKM82_031103 [Ascaphus truei]